jgi:hypothetical protein
MRDSGTPYVVLHSFAAGASDGAVPSCSGLTLATDGSFYGMTWEGGAMNYGTAFTIAP